MSKAEEGVPRNLEKIIYIELTCLDFQNILAFNVCKQL